MKENPPPTEFSKKSRMPRTLGSIAYFLCCVMFTAPCLHSQSREECLACHSDKDLSMERKGKTVSLFTNSSVLSKSPHRKLSCVSCHVKFIPEDIPHRPVMEPVRCTSCHANVELKHQFHAAMLQTSRRQGSLEGACKDCHGRHDVTAVKAPGSRFAGAGLTSSCGACHGDAAKNFNESAHGKALAAGIPGAPTCIGCHTQDIIHKGDRNAAAVKLAQERVCLSCHLDNAEIRSRMNTTRAFIAAYDMSAHGSALRKGNGKSANCVDCHGSHEMEKSFDPKSPTFRGHIPAVCAKCHHDISKEYQASIHGVALAKGAKDSPSCTDCHGEHDIKNVKDPTADVSPSNVSARICSPCHGSLALTERYGLSSGKVASYEASFHGLALRGGQKEVANCASCHGVHNIRPSSDPASTIHKTNLAATCGHCHPGATEAFAAGKIHVTESKDDEPILYWLATVYLILIFTIVGGMFIHNVADFRRKAIHKLKIRRGEIPPEHEPSHRLYLRMTLNERVQHAALMISFFVLVITGFMLRFPDAWWVEAIRGLSDGVFDTRSLIHRIAGVVMLAASVYHVGYLSLTERGRRLFFDLLPRLQDAKDAVAVLKYNFGFSKKKPRFDRFSYIEKSEYWALVWGNVVMGVTGVLMWFTNYFMNYITKLGWDIARTVHYYEAWLAFLAILVWHIYYVIFNPDAYPMNMAWIKGTISELEMAEEHPLELERIKAEEEIVFLSPDSLPATGTDTQQTEERSED